MQEIDIFSSAAIYMNPKLKSSPSILECPVGGIYEAAVNAKVTIGYLPDISIVGSGEMCVWMHGARQHRTYR